jgi:hypothetical protein
MNLTSNIQLQDKENKPSSNSNIINSNNFNNNPFIPKISSTENKENTNYFPAAQSTLSHKVNSSNPKSNFNLSTIKISSGTDTCSNFNTNYNIDNFNNTSTNAISQSHGQFKARAMPQYTYMEVKKSTHMLTIPVSPKLRTTARSQKKINK